MQNDREREVGGSQVGDKRKPAKPSTMKSEKLHQSPLSSFMILWSEDDVEERSAIF